MKLADGCQEMESGPKQRRPAPVRGKLSSPGRGILRRDKCNKRDKAMFAGVLCIFEVCTVV